MNFTEVRSALEQELAPFSDYSKWTPYPELHKTISSACALYGQNEVPPLLVLALAYKRSVCDPFVMANCCGTPKKLEQIAESARVNRLVLTRALAVDKRDKLNWYTRFAWNSREYERKGAQRIKTYKDTHTAILTCFNLGLFQICGAQLSPRNIETEYETRLRPFVESVPFQCSLYVKVIAQRAREIRTRHDWTYDMHWYWVLESMAKWHAIENVEPWAHHVLGFWEFFRTRYITSPQGNDVDIPF